MVNYLFLYPQASAQPIHAPENHKGSGSMCQNHRSVLDKSKEVEIFVRSRYGIFYCFLEAGLEVVEERGRHSLLRKFTKLPSIFLVNNQTGLIKYNLAR